MEALKLVSELISVGMFELSKRVAALVSCDESDSPVVEFKVKDQIGLNSLQVPLLSLAATFQK